VSVTSDELNCRSVSGARDATAVLTRDVTLLGSVLFCCEKAGEEAQRHETETLLRRTHFFLMQDVESVRPR
jgi:hypothetical protein